MGKNRKFYYIYLIPGKKIGVTRNLYKRVTLSQGYKENEYEVLFQSEDIQEVSNKEKELQSFYGFKQDLNSFKSLNKQHRKKMKINVTDQTTTFPVPASEIESYLFDNKGFKWASSEGSHKLDEDTTSWISKNIRVSHFDPKRSYVYNKALVVGAETEKVEREFREKHNKNLPMAHSIFDLIRIWAQDRGIYDKGDSKTQFVKLQEETGELARAILKRNMPEIKDSIGDAVVVLTNLARLEGLTIEDCIDHAYNTIKNRKGKMDNGTFKKETL